MHDKKTAEPDNTAVRTALWRALHLEVDALPHVFEDSVGLQIVAPPDGWRERPDMDADGTRFFRAAIIARARFIEDLVIENANRDVRQYVILGAGLDTFAQRRGDVADGMKIFEVDQLGPQAWKQQRLAELGLEIPSRLQFVPVDFEAGDDWWERLRETGFDIRQPAVVASAGVSMYLTRDAVSETLRKVARLARGSTFVMTFLVPLDQISSEVRIGFEMAVRGATASGTPFLSFFAPDEMLALARDAGFREARHVSAASLNERYFAGRTDGLRLPANSEELLVATT